MRCGVMVCDSCDLSHSVPVINLLVDEPTIVMEGDHITIRIQRSLVTDRVTHVILSLTESYQNRTAGSGMWWVNCGSVCQAWHEL